MPTLDATTTAVFNSVGLSAASIYAVFQALVGTTVSFMLWLIQVSWPFLLVLAFIFLLWRIINHYRHTAHGQA